MHTSILFPAFAKARLGNEILVCMHTFFFVCIIIEGVINNDRIRSGLLILVISTCSSLATNIHGSPPAHILQFQDYA